MYDRFSGSSSLCDGGTLQWGERRRGRSGRSGRRRRESTAEADGFLPAVLTLDGVRRTWRRTWRVSFDISVAKGKVSSQTHCGAVRTEGSVSQHRAGEEKLSALAGDVDGPHDDP